LSFRWVEAGEEFVVDLVGVPLYFLEMPRAGGCERDDVAAPVGGVGLTVDLVMALQAVEDAVDVVTVKAETAADFGLAERPVLLQRRQNREIAAGAQRRALGEEAGAKR
jgi:threonine dehydratase